jgi:hypothetical protein
LLLRTAIPFLAIYGCFVIVMHPERADRQHFGVPRSETDSAANPPDPAREAASGSSGQDEIRPLAPS